MRWPLVILALCIAASCSKEPDQSQKSHSEIDHRAAPSSTDNGRQSGAYTLTKESRFEVKTRKAGVFGGFAHNHVVRAQSFSGQMAYDAKSPGESHFEITVLADGLEILTAAKPSDKKKIREAMLTKVLKAKQYPKITFVSQKVVATERGARIDGELTLVGKTRPVSVDVVLKQQGDKLSAAGSFSIRQTSFGIKPYSAGLGTIKVADQVTFDFEAVGSR